MFGGACSFLQILSWVFWGVGGGAGRHKGMICGPTSRRGGREMHTEAWRRLGPEVLWLLCATSFRDPAGLENDTVRDSKT